MLRASPGTLLLVEVLGTGFVAGSSWYGTCCGWFWVLDGLRVRPGGLVWSRLVALYLWSHAYLGLVSAGLAAFVHAWFWLVSAGLGRFMWSRVVGSCLCRPCSICAVMCALGVVSTAWSRCIWVDMSIWGLSRPVGQHL